MQMNSGLAVCICRPGSCRQFKLAFDVVGGSLSRMQSSRQQDATGGYPK